MATNRLLAERDKIAAPARGTQWALLAVVLAGAAPTPALAGVVKGTVTLPAPIRTGRRFPGHWRVENGTVAVQPPGKSDVVVVATGPKGPPPGAKTYTVEINGFAAAPSAVVVGVGSVVEFKNSDRVAHELYTPAQSGLMVPERVAPGALRRQKFLVAGGYEVRCALYPHLTVNVVVVETPFFAVADDKGAFRLPEVPDGKATLKVWAQGRWIHEEPIEVKASMSDVQVKVAEGGHGESGE